MTIKRDLLDVILQAEPREAWNAITDRVTEICFEPFGDDFVRNVRERDIAVGEIDDLIATAAWELWREFQVSVPATSDCLKEFWRRPHQSKAVLILDGLSLREVPHILAGADEHGIKVVSAGVTASEIPPETDPFASALGFSSRSGLRSASSAAFPGAKAAVMDVEWTSCLTVLTADPDWLIWHTFPDDRIHALEQHGDALGRLAKEIQARFSEADFWAFLADLATGRSLVITSDHGYAAGGHFHDIPQGPTEFLRETFKGRRVVAGAGPVGEASPPLALEMQAKKGTCRLAVGRRKWPVPGGFPKLLHGGLSLFEVLSPFIEVKV